MMICTKTRRCKICKLKFVCYVPRNDLTLCLTCNALSNKVYDKKTRGGHLRARSKDEKEWNV